MTGGHPSEVNFERRMISWGAVIICAGLIFIFGQWFLDYQAQTKLLQTLPQPYIHAWRPLGAYLVGLVVVAIGALSMACALVSQGRAAREWEKRRQDKEDAASLKSDAVMERDHIDEEIKEADGKKCPELTKARRRQQGIIEIAERIIAR